jgi:hypothetical protein
MHSAKAGKQENLLAGFYFQKEVFTKNEDY